MPEFKQIVVDFCDIADFVLVYIAEAHPVEGWRIKGNYVINDHKTIEDRLRAAQKLASFYPSAPILVDGLEDGASTTYAAFPLRLYVVLNGQITYEGGVDFTGYKLSEVRNWLNAWKGQSNTRS